MGRYSVRLQKTWGGGGRVDPFVDEKIHPQHGSWKIERGGQGPKSVPGVPKRKSQMVPSMRKPRCRILWNRRNKTSKASKKLRKCNHRCGKWWIHYCRHWRTNWNTNGGSRISNRAYISGSNLSLPYRNVSASNNVSGRLQGTVKLNMNKWWLSETLM